MPLPRLENQSSTSVRSWLRSIAQKKALLSDQPR
jgi:hypothetical protein